jgi:2-phospho-L-lactate guanylyltransferase
VLVPVKAFAEAKLRLAPALPPLARAELAKAMATAVLDAARPLPTAVVCDDLDVAAWARSQRALVIWEPERGLNRAVEAGVERLGAAGVARVIVAHGDLPRARGLRWVANFPGVTIVPDRSDNGTNVICVPAGAGFTFSYGPGSFTRHTDEAIRLGLPLRVVRERALGHDVDTPADLPTASLPTASR